MKPLLWNLAASDPARVGALNATFADWERQMVAPAWESRLAPVTGCGVDTLLPF